MCFIRGCEEIPRFVQFAAVETHVAASLHVDKKKQKYSKLCLAKNSITSMKLSKLIYANNLKTGVIRARKREVFQSL